jgi:hypothetical protein
MATMNAIGSALAIEAHATVTAKTQEATGQRTEGLLEKRVIGGAAQPK